MSDLKYILGSTLILISSSSIAGGWADKWFDSSISQGAGSFESQKRGYHSGGSFSARLNLSTDYPITISPPKISAGCGGIDVFMGGLAFLDEDYIVQKFQNMLSAAPAVAFDTALKTMCKECSETLTKLEAATNYLNNLQLNECALTKKAVAVMQPNDPAVLGDMWTEISGEESLNQAMDRSWDEAQASIKANDNKPIIDLKNRTNSCMAAVKDIFDTGSVIKNATEKMGMTDYADIVRGYVGDVVISATDADLVPQVLEIKPCKENEEGSFKGMLYGYANKKDISGTCNLENNDGGVQKIVSTKLESIVNKIKTKAALSDDEVSFIDAAPALPVHRILTDSIASGTIDSTLGSIEELVSVGYAYQIVNDLFRNINKVFGEVDRAAKSESSSDTCDMRVYLPALTLFKDLHKNLNGAREVIEKEFQIEIAQYQSSLIRASEMRSATEAEKKKRAKIY